MPLSLQPTSWWSITLVMRAIMFLEPNVPLDLEEVEPIDPGPSDVVVRLTASGVCGSDHHVVSGRLPFPSPMVLGHEGAGVVEAVGQRVRSFEPGDTVITTAVPRCGVCWYCAVGQPVLCESAIALGRTARVRRGDGTTALAMTGLGTFADTMTVDESSLVKVETTLPAEELALVGCGVTTGLGAAIVRAQVSPGSSAVVVGCGGVGIAALQGAKISGAAVIIAVDPIDQRRSHALRMGATHAFDPTDPQMPSRVRSVTDGRGADYAIEAVGKAQTMHLAIELTRPGGTTVLVGAPAPTERIDLGALQFLTGERTILSSRFRTRYPAVCPHG
jgi:S-(hydroxymethyl)glutathione dehydrogenase / alcohol dehydrogenase